MMHRIDASCKWLMGQIQNCGLWAVAWIKELYAFILEVFQYFTPQISTEVGLAVCKKKNKKKNEVKLNTNIIFMSHQTPVLPTRDFKVIIT